MKKLLLLLIISVIILSPVMAMTSYTFKQDSNVDIKISCIDSSNNYCDAATNCYLTSFYPNGTIFIDNDLMTRNAAYYNYTLNHTNIMGEYSNAVQCDNSLNGFSTFNFEINKSGIEPNQSKTLIFIGLILGLFILSGMLFFFSYKLEDRDHGALKLFFLVLGFMLLAVPLFVMRFAALDLLSGSVGGLIDIMFWAFILILSFVFCYIMIYMTKKIFTAAPDMLSGKVNMMEDEYE